MANKVTRMPIAGYEGQYEVDAKGNVYSVDRVVTVYDNGRTYEKPIRGGRMKVHTRPNGYQTVVLWKDGKSKNHYVHRLVAQAFIPNPDNLPMINHKDENPSNNSVENLEWCTHEYNVNYGTGMQRAAEKRRGRKWSDEERQNRAETIRRKKEEGTWIIRRKNLIMIEYSGERLSLSEWEKKTGLYKSLIYERIYGRGWDVKRALTTPRKERVKNVG